MKTRKSTEDLADHLRGRPTGKGKGSRTLRLKWNAPLLNRSGIYRTVVTLQSTPSLPLPRSSPEGATTEWTVVAPADEAFYSFIDSVGMKGW